jgi:hypothetical protein
MALSQLGQTSRAMILDNGKYISFWQDRWDGECALMLQYNHLFQLCFQPNIFVYEVVMTKGLTLSFSRALTGILMVELNALYNLVSNISLSLESDKMVWRMTQNGKFSTHIVY